jgi:hypothetical protein
MDIGRRLIAALVGLAVVACGGGGDEGSGPLPPGLPGPDGAGDLTIRVLDEGARLLDYARFAVQLAHRFADSEAPASVTANCAYAGHITLQFADRDGDRRASPGDTVTALLSNCGVPDLARAATGTLRVDILSASPSVDVGLQARLTVVDSLEIVALAGGPNIGAIVPGTLLGSLGVQWSEQSTGSQLQAVSTSEDDLRFVYVDGGVTVTDRLRAIDVSQTTRYDLATISSSMSFIRDGQRTGTLRVRTPVPFEGDLNVVPRKFTVDAEMSDGTLLRAQRDTSVTQQPIVNTLVVHPDGSNSIPFMQPWGSFVSLFRDARGNRTIDYTSDRGGGYVVLAPWRGTPIGSEIDRICEQRTQAGVSRYRADALFQRTVAGRPGLSEPGSVLTIQFGRALAEGTAELQFRLKDAAEVIDAHFPTWHVATTTVRRGATYEIRPREALRQGRSYYLQASDDGVNWTEERIFLDPQGQPVNLAFSGFGTVWLDNSVVASAPNSDTATVAAASPARLRSEVTLRDGQAVAHYLWRQISGEPVLLTAPEAAETDVLLPSGAPRPVGEVVIELSVTDSLGSTDRLRVALTVGDHRPAGAALYAQTGAGLLPARRGMSVGDGSIFFGPAPGQVVPRVPAATELPGIAALASITPADGGRLTVGMYAGAARNPGPGQHGLVTQAYCNVLDSPMSGWFQVRDVAYADDGTITRLAVDFEQRCEAGFGEFQRGSYRFNSAVPMLP